ncbi:hypothetical protein Prudu_005189 [Prunus dulcis]|uniref:ARM repeat superfamily protein n=1 Tax=Prunus dulcis TaxID=3755 RepID=A0A4Y1QX16_PRUDU|nr:hypothetical protein Prudu_005189 [Prunus dulcis]
MYTQMGVISRQVFPVCESLCFFCPALRARSRHPVKRYKKLLAEIFPRSPDEEPNDRKISKLCEYASKTPLRIPKITTTLEQRCYKDLRTENFHSVKVVMCIYRKLLKDGTYMFNLDGMIPKLCLLAQEMREDGSEKHLRSAGLKTLSSMLSWKIMEVQRISQMLVYMISKTPEWEFRRSFFFRRTHDKEDMNNPDFGQGFACITLPRQNRHFILSILIKHLDHKNVLKNPNMQLDIVDVATSLTREAKVQSSVAIIGALSDMMRHLRKSIHCSLDDSNLGTENTSDETLIRSFQLAFSLRSISLGGGLQPSRRRSLFTLATSMIIFSAKAYNIVALAPCAKVALTNETIDPFLRLVDDSKLQAVNSGPDQESSTIRQQLLNDFLPDDACPLGTQLCMETPIQIYQFGIEDNGTRDMVEPPLFTIEDDVLPNATESQTDPDKKVSMESLSLISVDELLDSVLETTHQVGRLSVSTATDMPYLEMAGLCEALQMGKQQRLSTFVAAQLRQESLMRFSPHDCNQQKETPSVVLLGAPTSGNPFLDSNAISLNQSVGNGQTLWATEYQHYPRFQLPASSPMIIILD